MRLESIRLLGVEEDADEGDRQDTKRLHSTLRHLRYVKPRARTCTLLLDGYMRQSLAVCSSL